MVYLHEKDKNAEKNEGETPLGTRQLLNTRRRPSGIVCIVRIW